MRRNPVVSEIRVKQKLLTLAGVAFAVRLFFILIFPGPNYFEGISGSYIEVARNIVEGRGIVILADVAPLSAGESDWRYVTFIDRPLGYVFLILIPSLISSNPVGIQILQALLSALSVLLLFLIGKEMAGEVVAWRGAWLYALWPLSARFEIAVLPDAVMPLCLLATLWCLLKGLKSEQGLTWFGASGIVLGIGMTMRPDVLLLPLFLAAGMLLFSKSPRRMKEIAVLLTGAAVVVGLHTVRNYDATEGKIVPLGLGNGISMWEGISQFGDTLGTVYGDERMARLEGYRSWAYPDGIERDKRRFREAVMIILDNPLWYTGVMLKRIPVLLTPDWIMTRKFAPSLKEFLDSSPEASIGSYLPAYPLPALIRIFVVVLQYGTILLALFACWRHRSGSLLWLPATIIFYYIVIHVPTNAEARYFYPVIPLVLMLASDGWAAVKRQELH